MEGNQLCVRLGGSQTSIWKLEADNMEGAKEKLAEVAEEAKTLAKELKEDAQEMVADAKEKVNDILTGSNNKEEEKEEEEEEDSGEMDIGWMGDPRYEVL